MFGRSLEAKERPRAAARGVPNAPKGAEKRATPGVFTAQSKSSRRRRGVLGAYLGRTVGVAAGPVARNGFAAPVGWRGEWPARGRRSPRATLTLGLGVETLRGRVFARTAAWCRGNGPSLGQVRAALARREKRARGASKGGDHREKGPRNGRRREVILSASGGNCWVGRLAADHKAPRTEPSSKCLLRYARYFIQKSPCDN
jgi:hypothetical protein